MTKTQYDGLMFDIDVHPLLGVDLFSDKIHEYVECL
jgi:hypothetical protein